MTKHNMKNVGWMVLFLNLCHILTSSVHIFAGSILDGCLLNSYQTTSCDPVSCLFSFLLLLFSELPGVIDCHYTEKQSSNHKNV